MTSKPDGEKLIKMIVEEKNLVVVVDFLVDVVQFFRTPYNGSDVQPYQFMPMFNNYPPMVLEVKVSNVWAIIPGDYSTLNCQSLAILLDAVYRQSWRGDNWIGPGACTKFIEAILKKIYIFKTDYLVKSNDTPGDSNQNSPIEKNSKKGVTFEKYTPA